MAEDPQEANYRLFEAFQLGMRAIAHVRGEEWSLRETAEAVGLLRAIRDGEIVLDDSPADSRKDMEEAEANGEWTGQALENLRSAIENMENSHRAQAQRDRELAKRIAPGSQSV